jgi:hypothetical protein
MRHILFLFLLFSCATPRTQSVPEANQFFLDPVGKEYFLLNDGQLITGNPLGQNDFAFFDSSLGRPDVIDVSNPFGLLLFYADYGEVIILDRTLSEISRLDLFSVDGLDQPVTMARSADNGIWVFDSWDYRLKLLDQRGKVSVQSNDLRLTIKTSEVPQHLYVYQGQVMLHYPENNRLAVFTNYGRFMKWIDLPEAEQYAWNDAYLMGVSGENVWVWNAQKDEGPRAQVQGEVEGQWLPVNGGYRRLLPKQNKTVFKEIK